MSHSDAPLVPVPDVPTPLQQSCLNQEEAYTAPMQSTDQSADYRAGGNSIDHSTDQTADHSTDYTADHSADPATNRNTDYGGVTDSKFGTSDWAAVALAVALAVLWFMVFGINNLRQGGYSLPGLGITVVSVAFAATFAIYGWRKGSFTKTTVALLCAIVVLSIIPVWFSNMWLRGANCIILLGVSMVEFLLLAGYREPLWCRLYGMGRSCVFFFTSSFRYWPMPFRALSQVSTKGKGKGTIVAIGAGLLVAVTLLFVIVPLLTSADRVFSSMFSEFLETFTRLNIFQSVWDVIRVVIVAPMVFSLIMTIRRQAGGQVSIGKEDVAFAGGAVASIVVLTAINILYALFVFVQIAYLFGGSESSAIAGSYAEYARSGFFQLVAVAAINLGLTLAVASFVKTAGVQRIVLRALEVVLIVFTAVILASALWRMALYISVFGLSLLRTLTLLGMVFIAACLIAATMKVFKKDFVFFRAAFATGLVLWIAFNFTNIDAQIAQYNVDGYLEGRIEQVDTAYLASLSPDTLPALDYLAQEDDSYASEVKRYHGVYEVRNESFSWQKWDASYARNGAENAN